MDLINDMWRRAKQWRKVSLGPVAIFLRASRDVPVSHGRRARLAAPRVQHAETALLVGVGPGFGFALARKLLGCFPFLRPALEARALHRPGDDLNP